MEIDPNRLGDMYYDANYGLLEIDWEKGEVAVSVRSQDGAPVLAQTLAPETLK